MNRIVWTKAAQADFDDFDREFAELSLAYADRVGQAALAAARFLAEFPQAGPAIDHDLRKWLVSRTDYVLLYRVQPGVIEIVRMQHARRDWRPRRLRPLD